jgi:endonuclease/exonuclease/phosphatase family metal-dependent hydrolase
MTFNVKGDRGGRRGKELGCTRRFIPCGLDPGAIADEIVTRGARIVGLQEVGPRQAEKIEAALIERTGAQWQSVWELKHHRIGFGEDEGHAVYVRDGEIIGSIAVQYSNAPAEFRHASSRRIVQYAPVRFADDGDGDGQGDEHIVNVYVTHLQTGRARVAHRDEEAQELVTWTDQDGPAVIFGDFNATPDEPAYARMSARWDDVWLRCFPDANAPECDRDRTCGYTSTIHLTIDPNERLDYIWTRGADVVDAAVRLEGETYDRYRKLSDHMPVSATIRFRP